MGTADTILLVEDEKLIRLSLRQILERQGYLVLEAETGAEGIEIVRESAPDLVLLDYRLPDINGIEVLRQIRELAPEIGVVFLTAYSGIDSVVEAIKLGAYDYLNKPVNQDDLLASITKALETTSLRREVRRLRDEQRTRYGVSQIIGRSEAMRGVYDMIRKIAGSAASTVLIQGESGTGKDLVAKALHYASDRATKPFMNITCSALPETLLESELFGHEKGAFTDARQQKKGLIELADGGTVFLDEVGEMGLGVQAKLLRFLEEKAFKRVGGSQDIRVDVRIVAATNRDLQRAVTEGGFREDLFFRLNVIPICLPPLKDRREDIPELVDYFVDQFNKEFRKDIRGATPEMLSCLTSYDWPGNVRELRNVLERAMILGGKEQLGLGDLPEELVQRAQHPGSSPTVGGPSRGDGTPAVVLPEGGVVLREVEFELVRQALERTEGNQSRAARLLGISRDALRYKMTKFGLTGD
jgi:DNA-binding NtrC family response regulator